MVEVDEFLANHQALIDFARSCEFKDEENPVDNIVYPLICRDIPDAILNDINFNLTHKVLARAPISPLCFLRMSPADVPGPHKYHTDHSMGRYSMMIYLETADNAGTGFAQHKELGIVSAPEDQESLEKTIKDCNDDSKWQLYKMASMAKNKAVIFDSSLFHVALPIGGFGSNQNDSRIVLTCFFS